eukprot:scaffold1877_cov140-Isochrysis_galbana.AAC.2
MVRGHARQRVKPSLSRYKSERSCAVHGAHAHGPPSRSVYVTARRYAVRADQVHPTCGAAAVGGGGSAHQPRTAAAVARTRSGEIEQGK